MFHFVSNWWEKDLGFYLYFITEFAIFCCSTNGTAQKRWEYSIGKRKGQQLEMLENIDLVTMLIERDKKVFLVIYQVFRVERANSH